MEMLRLGYINPGVLILVVMEYGLRRSNISNINDMFVLILVVMEYGLRQRLKDYLKYTDYDRS